MRKTARAATYALVGYSAETIYSAIHDLARGRRARLRTSPWMLGIYGSIRLLFEPLHDRVRNRSVLARAGTYVVGFYLVEYTSGRLIREVTGEAPWDYGDAAFNLHGLVKPSYAPLWATAGLALEWLHDKLADGD